MTIAYFEQRKYQQIKLNKLALLMMESRVLCFQALTLRASVRVNAHTRVSWQVIPLMKPDLQMLWNAFRSALVD